MVTTSPSRRGVLFGLAAAVSFGISAPLAKRLLDNVSPEMLAGLLYVGAFAALSIVRRRPSAEARLRRADAPRMGLMILAGGIVAPVLLLLGLERVTGVAGSLLLNLEGPFTIVIGDAIFREHLPRPALAGAVVISSGAVVLGVGVGSSHADWVGILLIAAACAAWALDNNLTQALTLRDPRSIVWIKCGVAGTVNVTLAFGLGERFPEVSILAGALALGALGAAREAAIFAVAPFAGALLAPLVLPETLGLRDVAAGVLMGIGVVLLLRERHDHRHVHDPLDHDHVHVHDEHHQHEHSAGADAGEPHSHEHHHDALQHSHPHVSDAHHRHSHRSS